MKLDELSGFFHRSVGSYQLRKQLVRYHGQMKPSREREDAQQATHKVAVQLKRRIEEMRVEPSWLGKYSGYRNLSMK